MPFQSEAQRRFMWANHPEIAQRWADEMKRSGQSQKGLPYHKPTKGGHMPPKRRVKFGDIAAAAADGTSIKRATRHAHHQARSHRAAPDGSQAMPIDRNELVTDVQSPAVAGRHKGRATNEHMKRAMEMLMKARAAKKGGRKDRGKV